VVDAMATRAEHYNGSNGSLGLSLSPPGSPAKWNLDRSGRPSWIRALPGSSWATVFEWDLGFDHVLRLEMPALLRGMEVPNGKLRSSSEAIRRAAGLRDVCRCSYEYIARHARTPTDGRELERGVAKQRVREGRGVLHAGGVLPWGVFDPDGRLPKRWWRERAFTDALEEWQHQPLQELPVDVFRIATRVAGLAAGRLQQEVRPAQLLRVWRAITGS
jgi:hypothetical protein